MALKTAVGRVLGEGFAIKPVQDVLERTTHLQCLLSFHLEQTRTYAKSSKPGEGDVLVFCITAAFVLRLSIVLSSSA